MWILPQSHTFEPSLRPGNFIENRQKKKELSNFPVAMERVRQKSRGYLADSLLVTSYFGNVTWDEKGRQTAKCLGARKAAKRLGFRHQGPTSSLIDLFLRGRSS